MMSVAMKMMKRMSVIVCVVVEDGDGNGNGGSCDKQIIWKIRFGEKGRKGNIVWVGLRKFS